MGIPGVDDIELAQRISPMRPHWTTYGGSLVELITDSMPSHVMFYDVHEMAMISVKPGMVATYGSRIRLRRSTPVANMNMMLHFFA